MKFGFPWRVKGIRSEARETAREAARRAGLPLNEWLNTVILQQAAEQGLNGPSTSRDENDAYGDDLFELHRRLDELTRRIDLITRSGPAAYAPKPRRDDAYLRADLTAGLDQLGDTAHVRPPTAIPTMPRMHLPPVLDRAVAEFEARRRALSGEPAPRQPQATPTVASAVPQPNLSGLEDELRRSTNQIETLQRPGVEEAINALRAELADIGRALKEAMPRRALESIDKQIHDLTQRIAEGRQAGADSSTLAGFELRLTEVSDALRELTPAENLIGYTEAINALAHRIDLIVAERDPATMQQLQSSVHTLREMAAHVASNEAVSNLAAQVQALADRIDHLAASSGTSTALGKLESRIDELSRGLAEHAHNGDAVPPRLEALIQALSDKIEQLAATSSGDASAALGKLESRIDELNRALAERARNGDTVPPRLETLLQALSDKIEQLQQSRGDNVAFGHLEDRIVGLTERLDASNSRLGHLEAIERGLADLLVQIEDLRTEKQIVDLRAEESPNIDVLKQGIADTQDTLETMRGMLGHVVDRLAIIEKDVHGETQRRAAPGSDLLKLREPIWKGSVSRVTMSSEPRPAPVSAPLAPAVLQPTAAPPPPKPMPAAAPTPVDVNLPPDQPLEPGSGRPLPGAHPGARIAASEAALGGARVNMTTPGGKSNFIAAARRAAQAAGQDPRGRPSRPSSLEANGGKDATLRTKVITRVKSLFLAASIVAIIVGSIQFVSNSFDFSIFDSNDTKVAISTATDATNNDITATTLGAEEATTLADQQAETPNPAATTPPAPKTANNVTSNLLAPPSLSGLAPTALVPSGNIAATIPAPLNSSRGAQNSPMLLNPPALNAPPPASAREAKGEITGSIARTPVDTRANEQPAPSTQPPVDRLPAAIGSTRLRNAAANGDAAAAYQVAMRFAEGRGVPTNLEEAAHWLERAASKGLAPAQFRYASMLEKGQGVKKDLPAARKLYVAAAAKGHAKAMHNLAVLYAEGAEGKPDFANAAQWFRKAAERGIADSQYNLGVLTARGLGTDKNIAESYKWFALAAAQGDRDAGRKRDEVAAHLDAQTLAAAQQAVKAFAPEPQPAEATVVPEPPGGWDRSTTPPTHSKSRAAGPLSISAFNSGKL